MRLITGRLGNKTWVFSFWGRRREGAEKTLVNMAKVFMVRKCVDRRGKRWRLERRVMYSLFDLRNVVRGNTEVQRQSLICCTERAFARTRHNLVLRPGVPLFSCVGGFPVFFFASCFVTLLAKQTTYKSGACYISPGKHHQVASQFEYKQDWMIVIFTALKWLPRNRSHVNGAGSFSFKHRKARQII